MEFYLFSQYPVYVIIYLYIYLVIYLFIYLLYLFICLYLQKYSDRICLVADLHTILPLS